MPTTAGATPTAIATLYLQYHQWLCGWVYRKLGNRAAAQDISQDVFLQLLDRGAPVSVQEPRPFLSTIAKRLIIDRHRRAVFEQAYLEELAAQGQLETAGPEDRLLAVDLLMRVDALLDGVSPKARMAFLHCQVDGLTQEACGMQLGVSAARVRQYLATVILHLHSLRFERVCS